MIQNSFPDDIFKLRNGDPFLFDVPREIARSCSEISRKTLEEFESKWLRKLLLMEYMRR